MPLSDLYISNDALRLIRVVVIMRPLRMRRRLIFTRKRPHNFYCFREGENPFYGCKSASKELVLCDMRCEVLASQLPAVPSNALYSRRYGVIYSGSPFLVFPADSSLKTQVPRVAFQGHTDSFCLSRDERNIAISSQTLIKLYDVDSGREIRNLAAHCLPVHALCPKRNSIYNWFSGSLDSTWVMWDTRSHPAKVLDGRASGPIRSLEMSPDDTILAVGTDSSLQLYDIRNRQILSRFSYSSTGLCYNPAEKLLATYGLDRIVRFICMDQLECVSVSDPFCGDIKGLAFAGFSPENDFLVAGTDLEMRLLTWEPCDTLASCQLPSDRHVLNVSLGEDFIDVISYTTEGALVLNAYPIELLLAPEISEPPTPVEGEREDEADMKVSVVPQSTRQRHASVGGITPKTRPPPASTAAPAANRRARRASGDKERMCTRSQSPKVRVPVPSKDPSPNGRPPLIRSESAQLDVDPLSDAVFDRLKKLHKMSMRKSEEHTLNLTQAESAVRRVGLEEAISKEIVFYDTYILRTLLQKINEDQRWDLGLVHQLLPRIKDSLTDRECSESCVDALRQISDVMLDKLVKCARYQSSIGVDVAAEERQRKAEECLQTLRQLRDSRNGYYLKMAETDVDRLDSLMIRLKRL